MVTLAVDDDFAGFVAARWPDLEAVAIAATLAPRLARELTTSALASLGERWVATVDEGAPTRAARVELLRRIARLGPDAAPPPDALGVPAPTTPALIPGDVDEPASAVPAALLAALRGEEPLVRAALAAGAVWGSPEDEVAGLAQAAGLPVARLTGGLRDARGRFLAAHREALAADGLSPADWRLERDVADVVDALAAAQPDPPDPAALVADRARRVRRRTVLVGGAAVLAAGGAVSWLLRDAVAGGEGAADAAAAAPTSGTARGVAASDPVWGLTSQWPPRGELAGDSGIQALVIRDLGAGGRLVFADDVEGVRVVVATVVQGVGGSGTEGTGLRGSGGAALGTVIRAWSGAPGMPAEGLEPVELGLDRIEVAPDVVAVAVPEAAATAGAAPDTGYAAMPGGVLLVLSRPTVAAATWSPVVHPTVNGSVERTWTLIRMRGGIGSRPLSAPLGAAARIQCSGYDGPIPGARSWSASSPPRPSAAEVAAELVASATGVPQEQLVSRVVVDSPVAGSVFDAEALSATGGDGRVQVVHTTTPDRGLVRTLVVADDGRSGRSTTYGPSAVLPAADADQPLVRRLDLVPPRTMRYLVVAPGAARCQLLAVAPAGYPVSKVVPLKGDTAIVPIVNGQDSNSYRLVLWDARGRRTYSAVPPRGRALLDLEPSY